MNRIPVFVGMDYHQDSVQVCVERGDGVVLANRKCSNDIAEIVDVAERCGEVVGSAIESCTGAVRASPVSPRLDARLDEVGFKLQGNQRTERLADQAIFPTFGRSQERRP